MKYDRWEQTLFRRGDWRPIEAGRKGGLKSAETRRKKAEYRKHTRRMTADLVYLRYLKDVTEDELRDFIKWRGQKKRKESILAKTMLEDADEDTDMEQEILDMILEEPIVTTVGRMKGKNIFSGIRHTTFYDYVRTHPFPAYEKIYAIQNVMDVMSNIVQAVIETDYDGD